MPKTYADRLAADLREVARLLDEHDELRRLVRRARNLILIQQAVLTQKARQARILARRLAVAREDKHQLRRDRNYLRRRLARPAIVTEEAFDGTWPGE